jgi:hypothetical protein
MQDGSGMNSALRWQCEDATFLSVRKRFDLRNVLQNPLLPRNA